MERQKSAPVIALLRAFALNQSGATAIEYSMILMLVVIGIVALIDQIGNALIGMFNAALAGFT